MAVKVVVLVGGVGGAKLAYGLARVLPPEDLTVIVNTGDDFWHYGLRICPDLDTILYTLAEVVDKSNGWGVGGDTVHLLDALRRYGEDTWFRLGDQDVATHLLRTHWLREEQTLTAITARLAAALGVRVTILPMTDEPVATMVNTVEYGEITFQEYFVRYRWQPTVKSLRLDGIEQARMTDAVCHAIEQADIILIGPSNPWLSIDPILSVPGLRTLVESRPIPRVAVTPIVGGRALKGPAAKLMVELGYNPSPLAVADHYGSVINGFVYDRSDGQLSMPLLHTAGFETIMKTENDKIFLAETVLQWIKDWHSIQA
ncbi:MAG: 2-phospho-L-lactate transferase [Chloroflexi bacterium]|nr:2-phospho-L-lactate transferase [Chloroflexota bacterium]